MELVVVGEEVQANADIVGIATELTFLNSVSNQIMQTVVQSQAHHRFNKVEKLNGATLAAQKKLGPFD